MHGASPLTIASSMHSTEAGSNPASQSILQGLTLLGLVLSCTEPQNKEIGQQPWVRGANDRQRDAVGKKAGWSS